MAHLFLNYVERLTKILPIFFFLGFSVRLLTIKDFPSNVSLQILTNGTWKDLCITNWNEAERNLVCQAQGYNGSSPGVCSSSGTNSSGNTTHSCEQLTQDCEDKISREIKCSGIKTFPLRKRAE